MPSGQPCASPLNGEKEEIFGSRRVACRRYGDAEPQGYFAEHVWPQHLQKRQLWGRGVLAGRTKVVESSMDVVATVLAELAPLLCAREETEPETAQPAKRPCFVATAASASSGSHAEENSPWITGGGFVHAVPWFVNIWKLW